MLEMKATMESYRKLHDTEAKVKIHKTSRAARIDILQIEKTDDFCFQTLQKRKNKKNLQKSRETWKVLRELRSNRFFQWIVN